MNILSSSNGTGKKKKNLSRNGIANSAYLQHGAKDDPYVKYGAFNTLSQFRDG
jgi:hypothetical protein